jgi:hypothetical protein
MRRLGRSWLVLLDAQVPPTATTNSFCGCFDGDATGGEDPGSITPLRPFARPRNRSFSGRLPDKSETRPSPDIGVRESHQEIQNTGNSSDPGFLIGVFLGVADPLCVSEGPQPIDMPDLADRKNLQSCLHGRRNSRLAAGRCCGRLEIAGVLRGEGGSPSAPVDPVVDCRSRFDARRSGAEAVLCGGEDGQKSVRRGSDPRRGRNLDPRR